MALQQVQQAQDVLQFCARERTTLLDQLNLLAWTHSHPERFDWTGSATPDQITAAYRATQADFDLVAACGSNAIDNPAKAVLPASFATGRGTTYPSATMPTPMPKSTVPEPPKPQVEVPNLLSGPGRIPGIAHALLLKRGLRFTDGGALQITDGGGRVLNGNVVSQDPVGGTMVDTGSVVVLGIGDYKEPGHTLRLGKARP